MTLRRLLTATLLVASLTLTAQVHGQTTVPKTVDKPGERYFDFGAEPVRYIENDRLKVGFDLSIGGAIVYLEDKANKSGNMINSADWGRQIQLSYYSGPAPYVGPNGEQPSPSWAGLGWNPIQAGDCGGYGSRVLEFKKLDASSAFVRARPMLWPNSGVLAECLFECDYRLTANGFELTATIVNDRSDKTQYIGRSQETPAVYTNAPWYKLVTYIGDKPYENEPVTTIVDKADGKGWPWRNYYATEGWSALVNEQNYGIGVYQPNALQTSGGFHGGDGAKGQPLDSKHTATGYIAPLETTILDWNIKRSYKTIFIVGSLDEIRSTVYRLAQQNAVKRPNWVFDVDRQNWCYANTTDEGFPIKGALKINLLKDACARANSPNSFWKASDAPVLEIDLAITAADADAKPEDELEIIVTPISNAEFHDYPQWGDLNEQEKEFRAQTKPNVVAKEKIRVDGKRQTVRVPLDKIEGYQGAMKRLQIAFPAREGKATLYRVRFLEK